MQFQRLFGTMVLCALSNLALAMENGNSDLEHVFAPGFASIRDNIARNLEFRDLSSLDNVSRSMRHSVRQVSLEVVDEILTKKAILLSNALNALPLDCSFKFHHEYRNHFTTHEAFRNYVLEEIRRFVRN